MKHTWEQKHAHKSETIGSPCEICGEPCDHDIHKMNTKSTKVKFWKQKQGDMMVKVELWQDGPQAFEVAKWRLGQSVPTLYRFDNFAAASQDYSMFIELNSNEVEIAVKLQAENEMLHALCASAQCWLDAAGFLANGHETKCALQRNADEFRQAYAKITS